MRTGAVIAEFNPLHNGHKYVIDKIKSENDAVMVIMSGNFVQRGEAAILDKFARSGMAVAAGADIVLELPVEFAVNNAEMFAYGGISIAENTKCVDRLYFGSEIGDTEKIKFIADCLMNEKREVSGKIKSMLKNGVGFSYARHKAYESILGEELSDMLKKPNNILAVEYVKAIKKLKSGIEPETFARIGVEHDDINAVENIASASLIRKMAADGDDICRYIPEECYEILKKSRIADKEKADTIVLYLLRRYGAEYLKNINDVSEGLENRIYAAAREAGSIEEIVDMVCTKRYSRARIRRIIVSAILGIEKGCAYRSEYIRVLAMNKKGAELLGDMKKKAKVPIITKAADFKNYLKKEEIASDIYSVISGGKSGGEYTNHVFIKNV